MMRRVGVVALGVLLGGAFYLVLIDTTSLPELYVLAGAALLAGIAFAVSREEGLAEASISPAMLARSWRAIVRIPLEIVIVSWEALLQLTQLAPVRGAFRATPFEAVGEQRHDVGRRALAQAFGSLPPNTIVIGVDDERKLLLVHQLRRSQPREKLDVLDLG
jgi:multisubunit Na+/H+ antiporter MnhE subunit